jgi:cation:H+ antiporter
LEGSPNLSLGNVLGANIANLCLVGGLAAFIIGAVNVRGDYLKSDLAIALIAGLLPMFLAFDGKLSRVDGLILLAVFSAYANSLFREQFLQIARETKQKSFIYRFLRRINHVKSRRAKEFGRFFLGISLLLFSADMIVRIARQIASTVHMPVFLIGLVFLAIGTTLPEVAFSLRSLKGHEPTMFFGNLLGSIIINSTLVLGVVSLISPIKILIFQHYLVAAICFVLIFLLFWFFIRSKHRLERWEASFLFFLYLIFVVIEFL